MLSRIEQICIEKGLKMTDQRRIIARVLSEASDHPDVEEVLIDPAAGRSSAVNRLPDNPEIFALGGKDGSPPVPATGPGNRTFRKT